MKKIYLIILTVVIAVMMATSVSAITYTASPYRDSISHYDEAFNAMYEAIARGDASVEMLEYGIRTDVILNIFSDILTSVPEFFYLENKITYYYRDEAFTKIVTEVRFNYKLSGEQLENAKINYENELAYIVSLVDSKMSEVEKALWVHDYMIDAFEYDNDGRFFDAYSLFTERKGVCQAYSLAYIAVLRELGINAVMVTSEEMNHAWNLVEINGNWYHVDLVYDDPSPDRMGRVMHENFLLDDRMITKTGEPHYGWESSIKCSSSTYTDTIWSNVSSRMVYVNGSWYYIDSVKNTLAVSDISGGYRSNVFIFDDKWYVEGEKERYWVGIFSGVSQMLEHILINTPFEVIIYSPRTGNMNTYLTSEQDERIFGSRVYKNTLEYLIADAPDLTQDSDKRRIDTFAITDFTFDNLSRVFPFNDVSRLSSYYTSVRFVYDKGLFNGVSSTKFAPNAPLTRAMFVTVLGRLCNVESENYTEVMFDDVDEGQWYTPYVEWAAEEGLVNGVGANRFDPLGEITHEQMIKIVAQLGKSQNYGDGDSSDTFVLFEDRAYISAWAVDSVAYCVDNKLIDNVGLLFPREASSRADAAEIIARFARLSGKA